MLQIFLAPMRILPVSLHTAMLAAFSNHMLRGQAWVKRLHEVEDKVIALRVEDLAIELRFRIAGGRLLPARHTGPHVIIRGNHEAFISLALRRQDPDTLFFQRRLSVEGETETGVHIKNLMDAFDYDCCGHFNAVLPPLLARAACRAMAVANPDSGMCRHGDQHSAPPTPGRPSQ